MHVGSDGYQTCAHRGAGRDLARVAAAVSGAGSTRRARLPLLVDLLQHLCSVVQPHLRESPSVSVSLMRSTCPRRGGSSVMLVVRALLRHEGPMGVDVHEAAGPRLDAQHSRRCWMLSNRWLGTASGRSQRRITHTNSTGIVGGAPRSRA